MGDEIDELIDEVTVDAYGQDEQLWAFRQAFEEECLFPFAGRVVGTDVLVDSIDYSGEERQGLVAHCRRDRQLHTVSLLDVTPSPPVHRQTRRLLDAYRRWSRVDPLPPLQLVSVPTWQYPSFAGTGIQTWLQSTTIDLGPLVLTGLEQGDSRSRHPPVPASAKYQVVFGHAPDFSLARPPAGLLLAGHTHGGQVQLPFIGPLVTLTEVPRDQAVGHSRLDWGADLIVSRGVGMERKFAPRLRFLCRPEVVISALVPGGGAPQAAR